MWYRAIKGASSRGRGPWRCRLAPPIRESQCEEWISGPWPCASEAGELALLLKTRASVVLTQGFELGPFLGELLGD